VKNVIPDVFWHVQNVNDNKEIFRNMERNKNWFGQKERGQIR
jgi:hypothetical protein